MKNLYRLRMTLFANLLLFVVMGTVSGYAQEELQEKMMEPGEDVAVLLNTLNETLEENRNLKKQLVESKQELLQIQSEGNALRGQIRSGERGKERVEKRLKGQVDRLNRRLESRDSEISRLKGELEKFKSSSEEIRNSEREFKVENENLRELLKGAILQEERDDYVRLIEQAHQANEQNLNKITTSESQSQQLKEDLSIAYVNLGNIAFDKRDFGMAIHYYSNVLKLRPSEAMAHHNLGIIYDYYVTNSAKALHHYREYLQLVPVEKETNEIRERILELRLGQAMIPEEPLREEYFKHTHYAR